MFSSFNVQICWTSAGRNNKFFSFYLVVFRIIFLEFRKVSCFDKFMDHLRIFRANQGLFIFESAQTIQILHPFAFVHIGNVPKVNRFDIALYLCLQFLPVKIPSQLIIFPLIQPNFPSVLACIDDLLMRFGSLMH